jgi:hypothetical protein
MSVDNVTPIRDLHEEAASLARELYRIIPDIPGDGLELGYLLSASTQEDLRRAIPLLEEALRLLEHARDHEDPLFTAYCEAHQSAS